MTATDYSKLSDRRIVLDLHYRGLLSLANLRHFPPLDDNAIRKVWERIAELGLQDHWCSELFTMIAAGMSNFPTELGVQVAFANATPRQQAEAALEAVKEK